jgi:carbon-monoxide dehydrogenase small subunit
LIAEFAGNLDRRLSGTSQGEATAVELNGMALVFSLLRAQVARWVGRLSSKDDGAA